MSDSIMPKIKPVSQIIKECRAYKTRPELRKNNPSLYAIARRKGCLEQACSHMKQTELFQCVGCGENFERPLYGRGYNTRVFCSQCFNRSDYVKRRHRHKYLMASFGLSIFDYERMLSKQENKCASCGDSLSIDTKHVHVDHCHTTGHVRGILCRNCNLALGFVKDCPKRLQNLIKYLEYRNG